MGKTFQSDRNARAAYQNRIDCIYCTFPLTYSPNGWDIRNPYDILPELVEELRSTVDVLVLMSHLGIQDDSQIAMDLPAIDVILGSHTHHLYLKRASNQYCSTGCGRQVWTICW